MDEQNEPTNTTLTVQDGYIGQSANNTEDNDG